MKLTKADEQKLIALRKMGLDDDEALDVIRCDKEIDHGKPMDFDLSKEQLKEVKKVMGTGTRKTTPNYTIKPREKKVNANKKDLIQALVDFLNDCDLDIKDLQIINAERLLNFEFNDKRYDLTLVEKRTPKVK